MNFAENKKWPTSARWRGRTLDVVGGYVRGVGGSRRHLLRASALRQTVSEYHPLCTISCGLPPSGLQCYWVLWWAVKLQETGCYGVHGVTGYTLCCSRGRRPCTASRMGFVGDWPLATAVNQSNGWQPRAADAAMAEAAR